MPDDEEDVSESRIAIFCIIAGVVLFVAVVAFIALT
jgi:hypothetical protein